MFYASLSMYQICQVIKPCKLFGMFNLESTNTLIDLGKSNLEKGNFNDALSYFEQAILLDQKNPDLWNLKGTALRSLGRYNEAIDCFNKSLEIDPRDKNSS